MRKGLEDRLAELFHVPTESPSYDELFVFFEESENDLAIAEHKLTGAIASLQEAIEQRDAAWEMLNFIEDLEEDIMNPATDPVEKHSMLTTLFNRIKSI